MSPSPFQQQQVEDPVEFEQLDMSGGYAGHQNPRVADLETTALAKNVRYEGQGVRRDFGYVTLGAAATTRVLALAEHRYILDEVAYTRIVRLTRTAGGKLQLERWDGAAWAVMATSSQDIEDVYLSVVSTQSTLLIADGKKILRWYEFLNTAPTGVDFPASNTLAIGPFEAAAYSGIATVVTADASGDRYFINYKVTFYNVPGAIFDSTPDIYVNNVLIGDTLSIHYEAGAAPGLTTTITGTKELDRHLNNGDVIKVDQGGGSEALGGGPLVLADAGAVTPKFQAIKTTRPKSVGYPGGGGADDYQFQYSIRADAGTSLNVQPYKDSGSGWVSVGTPKTYNNLAGGVALDTYGESINVNIANMTETTKFGLHIVVNSGPGGGSFIGNAPDIAYYAHTQATLHLYNHSQDPAYGISYDAPTGGSTSVLALLSAAAPGARYIAAFADRLIALQDSGDVQAFAASADGDVTVWEGADTEYTALVDTRVDALDDLQALVPIGNNIAALFRKRSIMRVAETGNELFPVAVVPWIDGEGTESPFSPKIVPGGVMYLGHDLVPKLLTPDGGILPVGFPIVKELLETLTSNIHLVDAAYDGLLEEYYLAIPEAGAAQATCVWIFSYGRFQAEKKLVWRRREVSLTRILGASALV